MEAIQKVISNAQSASRRVAIFLPSLHGGGAERAMLVFARELLIRGYPVDLVVAKKEGPLVSIIPFGARVVDCESRRMLHAFPKFAAYLRANEPLAVYSTITHANIMAALTCRAVKLSAPLIVRQSNAPLSERKRGVMHAVTRRLIPLAYLKASSVIAVSEGVRAELISLQPTLSERTKVLPTPVLSAEVRGQGEQPPAHPWFTERRGPVILSAGRLERHKGMLELVRAFAVVRKSRQVKLMIIGEGSARPEIEAEVCRLGLTDDVDLPGFQRNPFSFMNHADLFVLNSSYEGLPNVLIQAMSFGTPIVSTDCKSGPSEILQDGRFGRLIPVGSHESLVTALAESLGLPKHRAAQESAWGRYGAEQATSAYLACANLPERPR